METRCYPSSSSSSSSRSASPVDVISAHVNEPARRHACRSAPLGSMRPHRAGSKAAPAVSPRAHEDRPSPFPTDGATESLAHCDFGLEDLPPPCLSHIANLLETGRRATSREG